VTVVRVVQDDNTNDTYIKYQWHVLEDEHVQTITQTVALQLLGGTTTDNGEQPNSRSNCDNNNNNIDQLQFEAERSGTYRGVLLMYQRVDLPTVIQPYLEKLRTQLFLSKNTYQHIVQCSESTMIVDLSVLTVQSGPEVMFF
jgi:hypothetical protein